MITPKLSPDQQAKHDEVMELAEQYGYACEDIAAPTTKAWHNLSISIAQLCAQIGEAPRLPTDFTISKEWLAEKLETCNEDAIAAGLMTASCLNCGQIGKAAKWKIDDPTVYVCVDCASLQSERDQLKAENKRLRKIFDDLVFDFLLGDGTLDGLWFGDKVGRSTYWWRTHLRQAINSAKDEQP